MACTSTLSAHLSAGQRHRCTAECRPVLSTGHMLAAMLTQAQSMCRHCKLLFSNFHSCLAEDLFKVTGASWRPAWELSMRFMHATGASQRVVGMEPTGPLCACAQA